MLILTMGGVVCFFRVAKALIKEGNVNLRAVKIINLSTLKVPQKNILSTRSLNLPGSEEIFFNVFILAIRVFPHSFRRENFL